MCEAQRQLGNKWSEMSRILHGRSENAIKNRQDDHLDDDNDYDEYDDQSFLFVYGSITREGEIKILLTRYINTHTNTYYTHKTHTHALLERPGATASVVIHIIYT